MRVKLPPRDLNPGPYPSHSINTYTYGVTIASMVCGGEMSNLLTKAFHLKLRYNYLRHLM